jgi:hypothetical protein
MRRSTCVIVSPVDAVPGRVSRATLLAMAISLVSFAFAGMMVSAA